MRLIVFDVDGTLVDSQALIVEAMNMAVEDAGLPPLEHGAILRIVGLSLPVAVAELLPGAGPDLVGRVAEGYRDAFLSRRLRDDAPLYPGARDCLAALAGMDDVLLGIATGKGRRGLDAMLDQHGLGGIFTTLQTADDNPSKPHPGMLLSALHEAGVEAGRAVMVGDTLFDVEMARAAEMPAIGVAWGYHPAAELTARGVHVAGDFTALSGMLEDWAR